MTNTMVEANVLIERASIRSDEGPVEVALTLAYDASLKQCAFLSVDKVGHLMRLARVSDFRQLEGRAIRVRRDAGWNGLIRYLGDIIEDSWLDV